MLHPFEGHTLRSKGKNAFFDNWVLNFDGLNLEKCCLRIKEICYSQVLIVKWVIIVS